MPFDVLKTAEKLEIGINDEGYFLYTNSIHASTHIACGEAMTAALLLKANGVRFFDYHPSLFNDCDATNAFIRAAEAVGFAV